MYVTSEDDAPACVSPVVDHAAFEASFRRHQPAVQRLCLRMLGNRDDAAEAVQETFLKAYRGWASLDGDCVVEAWLRRIARNVCIDQLRYKLRRPLLFEGIDVDVLQPPEQEPECLVTMGDPRVEATLTQLNPQHRAVLKLRFLWGLSHREIGEVLSKSPGQIKATLHRARLRFVEEWHRAGEALAA